MMHVRISDKAKAFFRFFKTAPNVKSDKVIDLERRGLSHLIIEAIRDERNGGWGYSKNKEIRVRHVGLWRILKKRNR
jgi:hypothetical protein